jgi:hypothetical protein
MVQEAGWAPGPVWTDAENATFTGNRSPDRPARSESLYRLNHPGPRVRRGLWLEKFKFTDKWLGKMSRQWEDNIKTDPSEIGSEGVCCIYLAQ